MENLQPAWRGRSISSRMSSDGQKFTAMVGHKALLYIPVDVLPNAVYKISLELCRESGNGILYCNLYGSKSFDFFHSKVICEKVDWTLFDVDVITKSFPKATPMVFRMWRGKDGTGTILVRRIVVQLEETPVNKIETKSISISSRGPKSILETTDSTPNVVLPVNKIETKSNSVSSRGPKSIPATTDSTPNVVPPANEMYRSLSLFAPKKRVASRPTAVSRELARKVRKESKKKEHRVLKNNVPETIECFKHHNVVDGGKKVLYLPANNTKIFQTGMYDAFINNGFELCTFDFRNFYAKKGSNVGEAFLRICREFRPDWIHMQLQFTGMIPEAYIKKIKDEFSNVKITNWTGDIRQEVKYYFIEVGKHIDLSLLSSLGQVELYKKHGCPNVEYWQIGVDPKFFHPLSDDQREELSKEIGHDVVFCAIKTNHFPDSHLRQKIVQALSNKFGKGFAIYGEGWNRFSSSRGHIGYYEQNRIYNGSKIAINVNHFNDVEMYFSDRQLITMASGTPVVCKYIPGLERYFENKKDVAWFNSIDECIELVNYYVQHPEEAAAMGVAGSKKVLEQHSYTARVKELAMRMGFITSSEESINKKREIYCKDGITKVLGVVSSSSDRRFRYRKTVGRVEFQGALSSEDIVRISAEFQPDLIHLYMDDKMIDLAQKIRTMNKYVALSCFVDYISNSNITKLSSFDYVVTNKLPTDLVSEKPEIISMGVDLSIENKTRADIIEEVFFILGDV